MTLIRAHLRSADGSVAPFRCTLATVSRPEIGKEISLVAICDSPQPADGWAAVQIGDSTHDALIYFADVLESKRYGEKSIALRLRLVDIGLGRHPSEGRAPASGFVRPLRKSCNQLPQVGRKSVLLRAG